MTSDFMAPSGELWTEPQFPLQCSLCVSHHTLPCVWKHWPKPTVAAADTHPTTTTHLWNGRRSTMWLSTRKSAPGRWRWIKACASSSFLFSALTSLPSLNSVSSQTKHKWEAMSQALTSSPTTRPCHSSPATLHCARYLPSLGISTCCSHHLQHSFSSVAHSPLFFFFFGC